jgi:DNA modification methylase
VAGNGRRAKKSADQPQTKIHQASAKDVLQFVAPNSVDLCITSPPYWNILNQRRTADLKDRRHYGNLAGDFGTIEDYGDFIDALVCVFRNVLEALKPGAYCCIVVMDLRKKNLFFPLHSDLAARLADAGYIYDDLVIWNRQSEYNNLRPLGYPSVFRVNKVHEFVLLMRKPVSC